MQVITHHRVIIITVVFFLGHFRRVNYSVLIITWLSWFSVVRVHSLNIAPAHPVSCMSEYLSIDCGGYMCINSVLIRTGYYSVYMNLHLLFVVEHIF